jgi:hypothetical protein
VLNDPLAVGVNIQPQFAPGTVTITAE